MSKRTSCWILWIGLAAMAPLPCYMVQWARVPVARILQLASATLAVVAVDGSSGVAGTLLWLMLGQSLIYLALLWLVASTISRFLARGSPRRVALGTILLLVVGLAAASTFEIYHTPFRTRSLQASLLEVFE